MKKLVSVFGPSECNIGDELYDQAVTLGSELARAHFIVVCGSYEGVMEGVAKGAADAGGRSVGVTAEVYHARGRHPNPYITKEIKVKSAVDQLMELLDLADAYIALGSSPGTLVEVMIAWDFMKKRFLPMKPLILLGDGWDGLHKVFSESRFFDSYSGFAQHVQNIPTAIQLLESSLGKQLDLPTLDVIYPTK